MRTLTTTTTPNSWKIDGPGTFAWNLLLQHLVLPLLAWSYLALQLNNFVILSLAIGCLGIPRVVEIPNLVIPRLVDLVVRLSLSLPRPQKRNASIEVRILTFPHFTSKISRIRASLKEESSSLWACVLFEFARWELLICKRPSKSVKILTWTSTTFQFGLVPVHYAKVWNQMNANCIITFRQHAQTSMIRNMISWRRYSKTPFVVSTLQGAEHHATILATYFTRKVFAVQSQ